MKYRKINFYSKKTGRYICSTNQSKTCKEALKKYLEADPEKNGLPVAVEASYQ